RRIARLARETHRVRVVAEDGRAVLAEAPRFLAVPRHRSALLTLLELLLQLGDALVAFAHLALELVDLAFKLLDAALELLDARLFRLGRRRRDFGEARSLARAVDRILWVVADVGHRSALPDATSAVLERRRVLDRHTAPPLPPRRVPAEPRRLRLLALVVGNQRDELRLRPESARQHRPEIRTELAR